MNNYRHTLSLILLPLVIIVNSCKPEYKSKPAKQVKTEAVKVQVQKLAPSQQPFPLHTDGLLVSKQKINLSFKTNGIISQLEVNEGKAVQKGQLLASLNLSEINAQLAKAKNAFKKAGRDLKRMRGLYRDSSATLEQVQDLQTTYEDAQSELKIVRFNQRYSKITAPADGKIIKKFAEQDELISPGSPIYQFASSAESEFAVKAGMTGKEIMQIQPGDSATVELDAVSNRAINAYVSKIAAASDPASGLFEVELTLRQPDAQGMPLKNGFFATATIYPDQGPPYYKIPMSALREGQSEQVSFFVTDSSSIKVQIKHLRPLHIGDDFFAVTASLLNGSSWVITQGADRLEDQQKININTNQ